MLMITFSADFCNPVSQVFYDSLIARIQFHQLSCSCGHSGCLTIHGYYSRNLKQAERLLSLRICRVKCSCCGKTHALIPSFLVPYSQVSLPHQVEIIASSEKGEAPLPVMEQTPSIDENTAAAILRRYRRFWRQRLLAQSIPLLPLPLLIRRCFDAFGRQFLQIRSTPNLLFSSTT